MPCFLLLIAYIHGIHIKAVYVYSQKNSRGDFYERTYFWS